VVNGKLKQATEDVSVGIAEFFRNTKHQLDHDLHKRHFLLFLGDDFDEIEYLFCVVLEKYLDGRPVFLQSLETHDHVLEQVVIDIIFLEVGDQSAQYLALSDHVLRLE